MRILITLFILNTSLSAWAANISSWIYADINNKSSELNIYDKPGQTGEESIRWILDSDTEYTLSTVTVATDSYEANLFIESNSGEILKDMNLSISFGASFDQVKEMLKSEDFRGSFVEIPSECSADAMGILILADNVSGELRGYCLLSKDSN